MKRAALFAILLLAAGLRLWSAVYGEIEFIEVVEFMPSALTITADHTPIRLSQHGSLPIYLIRLSSLMFGETVLGMRLINVIIGTVTVWLLYLTAVPWWGRLSGLIAALLLALERYHVETSGRGIDLPSDLLFVCLATLAFSRFLKASEPGKIKPSAGRWLYAVGVGLGLGFLCKELTAVMLPVIFLSFFVTGRALWLKRPEPWLAVGVFALVVAPDAYASFTQTPQERVDLWKRHQQSAFTFGERQDFPELRDAMDDEDMQNGLFMSYGDQLSRFRGIGPSLEPFYFYFGSIFDAAGIDHANEFDEFPYMQPIMGILLWIGVLLALRAPTRDAMTAFCLTFFIVAFVPFALVQLQAPHIKLPTDPNALWYWVDRTMLPAMLLTGAWLSGLVKRFAPAVAARLE